MTKMNVKLTGGALIGLVTLLSYPANAQTVTSGPTGNPSANESWGKNPIRAGYGTNSRGLWVHNGYNASSGNSDVEASTATYVFADLFGNYKKVFDAQNYGETDGKRGAYSTISKGHIKAMGQSLGSYDHRSYFGYPTEPSSTGTNGDITHVIEKTFYTSPAASFPIGPIPCNVKLSARGRASARIWSSAAQALTTANANFGAALVAGVTLAFGVDNVAEAGVEGTVDLISADFGPRASTRRTTLSAQSGLSRYSYATVRSNTARLSSLNGRLDIFARLNGLGEERETLFKWTGFSFPLKTIWNTTASSGTQTSQVPF